MLTADFGGTKIKLGLVEGSQLLASTAIDAHARAGMSVLLPEMITIFESLCTQARRSISGCGGMGLAFPCLVDPKTQRITSAIDKYPDATQFDFHKWAHETLHLSIAIENDANAALAGEWKFGAGAGSDDLIMMTLGTGIGTSAIINGVPLRGKHGQAGCLGGHFTLNVLGQNCVCGNIGCAETEASTWALPRIIDPDEVSKSALASEDKVDYENIFRLASAGDAYATELRDRSIRIWSAAAINLIHAYDPEILILGGGIMRSPEPIVSMMQQYINDHSWSGWGKVRVKRALLGDGAALMGMSHFAAQCIKAI